MDNSKEKLPIHIMIGRENYAFTVERTEEATFRNAARIINERLANYEQKYPGQSYEKYLSITLLDFAIFNLRLEANKDVEPVIESVKQLTAQIQDYIQKI
ncbi:MAG: cell division protein ZapA [Alloprevotella sp.]|nr:cell division protein ZapA [Alloprevotella sp.]